MSEQNSKPDLQVCPTWAACLVLPTPTHGPHHVLSYFLLQVLARMLGFLYRQIPDNSLVSFGLSGSASLHGRRHASDLSANCTMYPIPVCKSCFPLPP